MTKPSTAPRLERDRRLRRLRVACHAKRGNAYAIVSELCTILLTEHGSTSNEAAPRTPAHATPPATLA